MSINQTQPSPDTDARRNWSPDLSDVVSLMRDMSRQTDPDVMARMYGQRVRSIVHTDQTVSLSRRGLEKPYFRITRYSKWAQPINPWRDKDKLPLLRGGLFAELLYGDEPVVIQDLRVSPDDPAAPYLEGQRSAAFIPMYDGGIAVNGVVSSRTVVDGMSAELMPFMVWQANLFGRATHNLVLRDEVAKAYDLVERELQTVSAIQHSLLPENLPVIPGLSLASHYQTSRQAGGDYFDVIPYPGGRWLFIMADVSGHGTPAAVMMAITHAIVHSWPCEPRTPGELFKHVNRTLASQYTLRNPAFVTAFAAVYDPAQRTFTYARAGHNPPRWRSGGAVRPLDAVGSLPLGIVADEAYDETTIALQPKDIIVLYTDGITEAFSPARDMFGEGRLDALISGHRDGPEALVASIRAGVRDFTHDAPAVDDRTILVMEAV